MAFSLYGFIKGLLLQDESDRTKELAITIDPSATTGTRTTLKAAQTANRIITLPDSTDTLSTASSTETLTNKTINADSNTISNIDNNEIKALAAIDTTKLADGTVSNIEFQRLDGVTSNIQAQLDNAVSGTATVQANLDNHVFDTSGAHAGSAISNIPSGNLSAIDVQGALNELQTDVDTRATSSALTSHISNPTGAHTASAIANIPSGNLSAINVQSALNELQTDIDGISAGTSTASNVGSGAGIFKTKVINDLQFKSLTSDANITLTQNTNDISIGLAQVPAHTFKGNNTGSIGSVLDLTATQLTAELNSFVGDSGSGGTKGLVPAPATGDTAKHKILIPGGSWGKLTSNRVLVTTNYTILPDDDIIECSSSSFTLTIPTAVGVEGKEYTIKHFGSSFTSIYTLNTTASQTVAGKVSGVYKLNTFEEVLVIYSDGLSWNLKNHYCNTDWVNSGANTITGITVSPSQVGNTKTVDSLWWRRIGTDIEVRLAFVQSSSGTNTSGTGDYLFAAPSGATFDTTKLLAFGGVSVGGGSIIKTTNSVGSCNFGGNGFEFAGGVFVFNTTTVRLGGAAAAIGGTTSRIGVAGSTDAALTNSIIHYNAVYSVPILGWQP